jgi:methionine-rich copper-binding protein CopC
LAVLLLALGGVLLVPATGVLGHAAYDHSTPAQNEVVTTPPTQVDVFFKEDLRVVAGQYFVHVENDSGTQVSDGDGAVDDNDRSHITASIPTALADGRYIVRWKTVSDEDGDEAEGAFCFFVGTQPTGTQSTECAALEATPTEEATVTGTPPTAEVTSATTPAPSPTVAPSTNKDNGSNTGLIVGVIIGVIAVVVVVGGGAALYMRRSQG